MKRFALVALAFVFVSCGDSKSPTAPSGGGGGSVQTETRVMALEGDLDFGDVRLGTSATKTIRVVNRGSGALSVTGISWPTGGSVFTANWTDGSIAVNQSQDITVTFTPVAMQSYSGTATVRGNQTSGTNTMPVSARGMRDPFSRSGSGNTVFDMPAGITRLRIIGTYTAYCSNFIVRVGGRTAVNEIIGACDIGIGTRYEGTHVTSGTVVEVTNSSGVLWSVEEIR